MPTSRPRYTFTDTGRLRELLDEAQELWPGEDRKDLVMKLVESGAESIRADQEEWSRMVEETAGMLTGVYPEDALQELREDWPA